MDPNLPLYLSPGAYNWLWGYFVPIGLLMLVWAGLAPRKARRVTGTVTTAIALSFLGYWAVGFALHMGGAFPVTQDPALQGLDRMLPIVRGDPGWGVLGLSGFFLYGDALTPTVFGLFLAYLPVITTAALLVTLALAHTRRLVMVVAGLLTATVIVPVAACWMWGSGWLSHLGTTMELGYGFVDFGGSGLLLWLPAMIVLPILLLQPRPGAETMPRKALPPRSYAPLMANVGALLLGMGWLGWQLAGPFHVAGAVLDWQRTAINVLLGMAGAALTSQLYSWLMLGSPEALLASQGLGAGWGAVLACAAFVPPWAAVSVGAVSGLLFPLVHYALSAGLRIRDAGAAVAMGLTAGPLGLLAVAILADGRWGQGWNGIGVPAEGRTLGMGVAGLFTSGDPGQLWAQLTGLVALGAWGLLWGALVGILANPGRLRDAVLQVSHSRVEYARPVASAMEDEVPALAMPPAEDAVEIGEEQDGVPSNGGEPAIGRSEPELELGPESEIASPADGLLDSEEV
jgi:ammonium transporter, Amt family